MGCAQGQTAHALGQETVPGIVQSVLWNNHGMIRFVRQILQGWFKFLQVRVRPDFELSPFGVAHVDAQTGQFKRVNTAFARLVGRSVDQLLSAAWPDLTVPGTAADPVKFTPDFNQAAGQANLSAPPAEAWVQHFSRPDGSPVVAEVSFLTRVEGTGQAQIWVLIIKDIADRLREQNQLRVSEQRHRVLADSARDVIWSMSPAGEITYVSPAVEKLRGVTPAEAMKLPLDQTLAPDSAAVVMAYFQQLAQALQDGRQPSSFHGELEYLRKDGSTFWTECLSFPLLDDQGGLVEVVGVTRDISERRNYEDSLRLARLQAEKANMAKTRFLGHISHEIRTPMSAMMALTDLLLHSNIDAQQREWLQQSHDAGRLLLGMINDILDLTKMDSVQLVLERQRFDLNTVLQQVGSLMVTICESKGLDFQVDLAPDVPSQWWGDAPRLTQALMNLVSNAVKFTDQGHVRVRVQRLEQHLDWEQLRFTVHDSGRGLDPSIQTDVFQGFEPADAAHLQRPAGIGLGLTLCKRLVQLMGGDVGVESVPGHGASFWFTVRLQSAQDSQCIDDCIQRAGQGEGALAGLRILVVDDNHSIRDIVKQLLQLSQVHVDTAENGLIALDMLEQAQYDLVLMDMQMPVMGGLEATRKIRQNPALQNMPIVALTAGGFASELDAWKVQGMTDYLGKPFDYRKLLTVLHRHLPASSAPVKADA